MLVPPSDPSKVSAILAIITLFATIPLSLQANVSHTTAFTLHEKQVQQNTSGYTWEPAGARANLVGCALQCHLLGPGCAAFSAPNDPNDPQGCVLSVVGKPVNLSSVAEHSPSNDSFVYRQVMRRIDPNERHAEPTTAAAPTSGTTAASATTGTAAAATTSGTTTVAPTSGTTAAALTSGTTAAATGSPGVDLSWSGAGGGIVHHGGSDACFLEGAFTLGAGARPIHTNKPNQTYEECYQLCADQYFQWVIVTTSRCGCCHDYVKVRAVAQPASLCTDTCADGAVCGGPGHVSVYRIV